MDPRRAQSIAARAQGGHLDFELSNVLTSILASNRLRRTPSGTWISKMADMQAYLAKHYLSGPKADAILAREEAAKAGRKKKKRKIGEGTVVGGGGAGGGLIVDDDVGTGWGKLADEETDLAPGASGCCCHQTN